MPSHSSIRPQLRRALAVVSLGLASGVCVADAPDARGLYFHHVSGFYSGTEWLEVRPVEGVPNRYQFRDVLGGGANGDVLEDGTIAFVGGVGGGGAFLDPDQFELHWIFGGGAEFFSDLSRAPFTTTNFPFQPDSLEVGSPSHNGDWSGTVTTHDPETGAALLTTDHTMTSAVLGTTFKLTLDDGTWYRFVFESPRELLCRLILPVPVIPEFRTVSGCSSNDERNVIGFASISEDGQSFTATLFLETRETGGDQEQSLVTFTMSRATCLGDFDSSGDVGFTDLTALLAAWATPAGDLDGDGTTGFTDLVLILGAWGPCV